MKVSELCGALLDYWVARAEGHEVDPPLEPGQEWPDRERLGRKYDPNYCRFSTDWQFGGPLIDRERISVVNSAPGLWTAGWKRTGPYSLAVFEEPNGGGPTALIAAMRAFVASKFGEEVPDL